MRLPFYTCPTCSCPFAPAHLHLPDLHLPDLHLRDLHLPGLHLPSLQWIFNNLHRWIGEPRTYMLGLHYRTSRLLYDEKTSIKLTQNDGR